MKLSNMQNGMTVVNALTKINQAIAQCDKMINMYGGDGVDCGGVPGLLERGYFCSVSVHEDGSGIHIPLTGCYVGIEIAQATNQVLKNKRSNLLSWLEENGVEIDTAVDFMTHMIYNGGNS